MGHALNKYEIGIRMLDVRKRIGNVSQIITQTLEISISCLFPIHLSLNAFSGFT